VSLGIATNSAIRGTPERRIWLNRPRLSEGGHPASHRRDLIKVRANLGQEFVTGGYSSPLLLTLPITVGEWRMLGRKNWRRLLIQFGSRIVVGEISGEAAHPCQWLAERQSNNRFSRRGETDYGIVDPKVRTEAPSWPKIPSTADSPLSSR
jgi:hypothetical protein